MNPTLSIIVPVYNVKEYLEKCIDSILNQSFKNFELILVDDGSTDGSEIICDEYALKDDRIKVIHKENGGQSSARNMGLDIAIGKYIGFVDSDDWIEIDMYEILYELITSSQKDIANVGIKFLYLDYSRSYSNHEKKILTKQESLEYLLKYDTFGDYMVVNLFKVDLIKKFRFKEGIHYEDIDLMYKIIDQSNGLVTIGAPKYNYLQREGSTIYKYINKISLDRYYVLDQRIKFIKKKYPKVYKRFGVKLRKELIDMVFIYIKHILENNKKSINNNLSFIFSILNNYFYENLKTKEFSLNIKIQLILLKLFPNIYIKIFKIKFKL